MWNGLDAAVTSRCGVPLGLLTAMRVITTRPGQCRVQEVADDIGITVGAASKVVDRLERAGLARRVPNPADRRSSLLELTDAGGQTLSDGLQVVDERLRDYTSHLDAEQIQTLTAELEQLRDAARRPNPPAG